MTTDNQETAESVIPSITSSSSSSSNSSSKTMVVFNQEISRQEIVSRNTGRYDELMISSSEEEEEDDDDDDDIDNDNDDDNGNGNDTASNIGNLPGLGNRCTAHFQTVVDYSSSSSSSSSSSERSNSTPQLVVTPTRTGTRSISLRRVRRRVNDSSDSESDQSDNDEDDDEDTDNYVTRARRRFLPRIYGMHARVGARRQQRRPAPVPAPVQPAIEQQQQRRFHRNESDSDDDAASSSAASSSMGSMPGLQERAREDSSTDGDDNIMADWNVRLPHGGGLDDDELVPHPRNANHNHNAHDTDANDHAVVGRIGMIDQLFMDQLRIRDRQNLWGSENDTEEEEEEDEREMPRLIQRNQQNHDSSSEEDDADTDTDEESTVDDGGGGLGLPQTPWVIRNRYRYHLETIPHPVWPIILAQAQHTPRYLNGLPDKHTGVYQLLRKGPLFLQNTNTNTNEHEHENEEHYG